MYDSQSLKCYCVSEDSLTHLRPKVWRGLILVPLDPIYSEQAPYQEYFDNDENLVNIIIPNFIYH
jgi:hypothetical protein